MSEYLGALRRIGVFSRQETHLMVYDEALVVARSSDAAVVLGAAIGLGLGSLLADRIARRGESRTPQEIANEAPQNRVVPLASVTEARLRKVAGGLYRELELRLVGDIEERIKWQRGDNADEESVSLLQKALGDRLTVEWEQAAEPSRSQETPGDVATPPRPGQRRR